MSHYGDRARDLMARAGDIDTVAPWKWREMMGKATVCALLDVSQAIRELDDSVRRLP